MYISLSLSAPSQSGKRRASSIAEAPPKVAKPAVCNPEANDEVYIDLEVINGKPVVSRADFLYNERPNFVGDKRMDRVHLYPRNDDDKNWLGAQTRATASFHGGDCNSCMLADNKVCGNPGKKGPKVFLLGDELLPVLCGSSGECCLTLRVEAGTFQQLERFLEFQFKNGLKAAKGSVAVVTLFTHLRRNGVYEWWSDFKIFADHILKKFSITAIPYMSPFPEGLEYSELIELAQSYKWLQFENYGRQDTANKKLYSLWKTFQPLAVKSGAKTANLSVPSIRIFVPGAPRRLVRCSGIFLIGFPGDFSNGLPKTIESDYLILLCDELRSLLQTAPMPMSSVKVPSTEAVTRGLLTTSEKDLPHKGRSIFLIGSSNLKSTTGLVEKEASALGVHVFSFARGVDHQTLFKELTEEQGAAIRSATERDVLILDFFGNSMIYQISHYGEPLPMKQYVRHVEKPAMLSDQQMNCLCNDTIEILDWVSKNFRGKVILCGPPPRYLVPCCVEKSHTLRDAYNQAVDMEKYTNVFNNYVKEWMSLPKNCEFYDYRAILSGPLTKDDFTDRVHFTTPIKEKFASFIVSCLHKKPTSAVTRPPPHSNFSPVSPQC